MTIAKSIPFNKEFHVIEYFESKESIKVLAVTQTGHFNNYEVFETNTEGERWSKASGFGVISFSPSKVSGNFLYSYNINEIMIKYNLN